MPARTKTAKAKAKRPSVKSVKARRPAKPESRKPMVRARGDLGADVGIYFAGLRGEHRKLAERLDAIVRSAVPGVSAAIKYGMPVYEHHGMLCYIRSQPAYVTLGFYYSGTSLDDPKGVLEGTGQTMRHVKCAVGDRLDAPYLTSFVKQAARINETD